MITIIILIAVVGLLMYLVNQYVPMAEPFKKILNITVVIVLIIWILHRLGAWHYLNTI